jgi:hypothetical protein
MYQSIILASSQGSNHDGIIVAVFTIIFIMGIAVGAQAALRRRRRHQ